MPVKSKHQQKYNANPTGKGGFGDRPWTINRTGRWNPADSYPEQLRRYFRMTAAQLDEESRKDGLTTAQMMALTVSTPSRNCPTVSTGDRCRRWNSPYRLPPRLKSRSSSRTTVGRLRND